jgi:hypothetical protein
MAAAESGRRWHRILRCEEAIVSVEQVDGNSRSKPARVLRAKDVIPPYGEDVSKSHEPNEGQEGTTPRPARVGQSGQKSRRIREPQDDRSETDHVASVSCGTAEIPAYDLAENILAEHRRVASKRRKAPGEMRVEPAPCLAATNAEGRDAALPPVDLPELQRVVAQIVARDIERLCKRPAKAPCG